MIWYTGLVAEQYTRKSNSSCLICKTLIYRRPAEIEKSNGRVFCSASCYGLHCRKEIPCSNCGKLILSGLNKKTCSRICANQQRTGSRYKVNRLKDKATTLRRLKIKLFNERGEKCERCNYKKREVLQVHHKNKNHTDNRISNLELICPNCHYEEHYLRNTPLFK